MANIPAPYIEAELVSWGFHQPDRGASRLFMAEDSIPDVRYKSLTEVLVFLNKNIIGHPWWEEGTTRQGFTEGVVPELFVTGRSHTKYGYASIEWEPWYIDEEERPTMTMYLPRWAWRRNIVLHELAHMVVDPRVKQCHGPAYARTRLEAQYLFSKDGPTLERAYREWRVRR